MPLTYLIVIKGTLIVPCGRVDTGEGEILMSLLTQQAQEGHLDHAHRFVRHFGSAAHVRVPLFFAADLLAPRNVGHFGRLKVRVDASFARASHVTKNVNGIVRHAQVGIDPVPTCQPVCIQLKVFSFVLCIFFLSRFSGPCRHCFAMLKLSYKINILCSAREGQC